MGLAQDYHPAESDVRFLEYRLEVVSQWAPSQRKRATLEAISRRLAAIGRGTLARNGVGDLLARSCRLLDGVFAHDVGDHLAGI